MRKRLSVLLLLGATLLVLVPFASAQTGLLYGQAIQGRIDAASAFGFFSFSGNEGDLVTVRLVSLGGTLRPTLSINNQVGQQLVFSNGDATGIGNNARLDLRLPQSGAYSIQVGGANGSQGEFVLRLDGVSTLGGAGTLSSAAPLTLDFAQPLPQVVQVVGNPAGSQTLSVNGAGQYGGSVHNANGALVGTFAVTAGGASFLLPAADGTFYIALNNLTLVPGSLLLQLGGGSSAGSSTVVQPNVTVSTPVPPSVDANVCSVIAANQVNLRSGPGTNYGVVGSLAGGSSAAVTGQNSGWYTINYAGVTAWVFSGVVNVTGPCANAPFVPAPAGGQQQQPVNPTSPVVTATVQPGQATPTVQQGATQFAPTVAPTQAAPTVAPTAAFPDSPSQYLWELDRDAVQNPQFSQTISAPGWHVVRVRVTGLSNQGGANATRTFNFIFTCTDGNLRWGTTAATQPNGCNATTSQFFTADSDQLTFHIKVESSGAPVNYIILAIKS